MGKASRTWAQPRLLVAMLTQKGIELVVRAKGTDTSMINAQKTLTPMRTNRLWGLLFAVSFMACEPPQYTRPAGDHRVDVSMSAVTLSGVIRIRTLDAFGRSETQHIIETGKGQRTVLLFDAPPPIKTGAKVEVAGSWTNGGRFAVTAVRPLAPTLYRTDTALKRSPVHHRVAILAMQEADIGEDQALTAFNGPVDSLQHFYAETSFGWDTFTGDIFRRYDISYEAKNCQWDNTYDISDRLIAAFEEEGNDASKFDHIVCIVPVSCGSDWEGAWADVGGIGNQAELSFELISMYKDDSFGPWYLAHELGHNLGMTHSRSIDCGGALYLPGAKGCTIEEYGNYNDVMGWGEGVYFGAAYQRYLGWIAPAFVVTANRSDTFNLHPSDSEMCGIHAVRIPITGEEGSYFYLEYRRARSDSRYAGIGDFGGERKDAVILTVSRDGGGGAASSNVDRVEVGTSHYEGIEMGLRYDLGGGVAVTAVSMQGPVARIFVETPGSGEHLADDGSPVFVAADGSIGRISCAADETDTDVGTDAVIETDTDSGTDAQTGSGAESDSIFDADRGTESDLAFTGDSGEGDHPGAGGDTVSEEDVETDTASPKSASASSCRALVSVGRAKRQPLLSPLYVLSRLKLNQ